MRFVDSKRLALTNSREHGERAPGSMGAAEMAFSIVFDVQIASLTPLHLSSLSGNLRYRTALSSGAAYNLRYVLSQSSTGWLPSRCLVMTLATGTSCQAACLSVGRRPTTWPAWLVSAISQSRI